MLNILDLDDVMMNGKAKLDSYKRDFEKQYYAPLVEMQMAEMWQNMPDEIKLQLRQENKQAFNRLDKKLGGT